MDLLEVLGDIALAQNMLKEEDGKEVPDEVPHIMDQNFKKLNNGLKLVDKNSKEFKIIETYTYNTMGYRKVKIIVSKQTFFLKTKLPLFNKKL